MGEGGAVGGWRVARIALPMPAVQPASLAIAMSPISKVEWSSSSRGFGRKVTEPRRCSLVAVQRLERGRDDLLPGSAAITVRLVAEREDLELVGVP